MNVKIEDSWKNVLKDEFKKLRSRLLQLAEHPYEKRAFLYLDIISWLESKISNVPVQTIIRKKYLQKLKEKAGQTIKSTQ